jgi:hypothetical protein
LFSYLPRNYQNVAGCNAFIGTVSTLTIFTNHGSKFLSSLHALRMCVRAMES